MKKFNYLQPKTVDEAISILKSEQKLVVLAGGTDLVIHLREKKVAPDSIVDISLIPELKKIEVAEREVKFGAMVSFAEAINHSTLQAEANCLIEACNTVGAPQIRNQGTIGGNIANASPAADSVPALVALGARVIIQGSEGTEEKLVTDILAGVGKNNLAQDQLVTAIIIPRPENTRYSAFTKLARRNALAISRISMAASIEVNETGVVTQAGISLGSVAPNPFRVSDAENILLGSKLEEEMIQKSIKVIAEVTAETLGQRASAVYKNPAMLGVANQTLTKLKFQLQERG